MKAFRESDEYEAVNNSLKFSEKVFNVFERVLPFFLVLIWVGLTMGKKKQGEFLFLLEILPDPSKISGGGWKRRRPEEGLILWGSKSHHHKTNSLRFIISLNILQRANTQTSIKLDQNSMMELKCQGKFHS